MTFFCYRLKKATAIFFLIVFSFNWFGYRLMYTYMQHEVNKQLEVALDNQEYEASELMVIKIAIHLPYQTNWTAYERYSGDIELNGLKYKYVERKLTNDTLYLKCIPNQKETMLEIAKNDLFKLSNNFQTNRTEKTETTSFDFKNFQPVFNQSYLEFRIAASEDRNERNWNTLPGIHLLSARHLSPEQPPDFPFPCL